MVACVGDSVISGKAGEAAGCASFLFEGLQERGAVLLVKAVGPGRAFAVAFHFSLLWVKWYDIGRAQRHLEMNIRHGEIRFLLLEFFSSAFLVVFRLCYMPCAGCYPPVIPVKRLLGTLYDKQVCRTQLSPAYRTLKLTLVSR
jgi:hypothetical protein